MTEMGARVWRCGGGKAARGLDTVSAMRTGLRLCGRWVGAALVALALVCGASAALAGEPPGGGERLHIELRLAEGETELSHLLALGFELELALPDLGRAQGWIAAERLDALRGARGVLSAAAPSYAVYARGSALSEGDAALGAAAARERFGVDGTGVRVAVISDGIRGLAAAQERGDAPQLAEALAFGAGRLERGAEGTAMLELVHDLAPGAELSFGAVLTDLDMIAAVRHFAQRVDVIVDDLGFLYPDDQQSEVSRNTAAALAQPDWPLRAYVTAAGNWAQTHWAGRFVASRERAGLRLPNPGTLHDWAEHEPINGLRLASGASVVVVLHWNEPWGAAQHDFDLYLLDERGRVAASSTDRQAVDSLNPREVLHYRNDGADGRFGLVVQNWRGAAAALELEVFALPQEGERGEGLEFATGESSLLAQSDAGGGVITVAAITPDESGMAETAAYSSQGPTNNGAAKPDIAAIDGVQISEASDFGARFFGTSAAAPHVAAVAALVLEAQGALLAADGGSAALERRLLRELLLDTAVDIGAEGRDSRSGTGRIDAEAALDAAQRRIVRVSSAADHGASSLRDAISAMNAGEAEYIAFDGSLEQRVITLESPLPAVQRDGAVIDGAGWRIDARNVAVGLTIAAAEVTLAGLEVVGAADAGLALSGADARVIGVRAARNGRGVVVTGARATLEQIVAVGNRGAGVVAEAGSSGQIGDSWIGVERDDSPNGNSGPGVLVQADAGAWRIGAAQAAGRRAAQAPPPIAPLYLPALETRSGGQHRIQGVLLIDGLPAPRGASVDLWLDRRPAGSAVVGEDGQFQAAVAGPGALIRFSAHGATAAERVTFEPGEASYAVVRLSDILSAPPPAGGNRIAHNLGPAVAAAASTSVTVRANLIRANQGGWIARDGANGASGTPRIIELAFASGAAELSGLAPGAASVDLYAARGAQPPRYLAGASVGGGAFRFARLELGEADRFWVVAHDAAGSALAASPGWSAAAPPAISDVSPPIGGYTGGEPISISGERFRVDDQPPRVFIGGAEAALRSADNERLVVESPAADWRGPTDLTVLRSDGRLATLRDAFAYDELRRVTLESGWNTVTWFGPPTRITAAIAPIAQAVRSVFAWDAAAGRWLAFSPDVPGSLNTLRQLPGGAVLWVYNDSPEAVIWPQPLE